MTFSKDLGLNLPWFFIPQFLYYSVFSVIFILCFVILVVLCVFSYYNYTCIYCFIQYYTKCPLFLKTLMSSNVTSCFVFRSRIQRPWRAPAPAGGTAPLSTRIGPCYWQVHKGKYLYLVLFVYLWRTNFFGLFSTNKCMHLPFLDCIHTSKTSTAVFICHDHLVFIKLCFEI